MAKNSAVLADYFDVLTKFQPLFKPPRSSPFDFDFSKLLAFLPMEPIPQGHTLGEDGDHDPDACYECLLSLEVKSPCRCAECCKRLIIEVGVEDAEREPKIKDLGSPIYTPAILTGTGQRELEGYLLNRVNGPDVACVFLDQKTDLCTIYDTRPLTCRLFDCAGAGRDQLIELGILPPRPTT